MSVKSSLCASTRRTRDCHICLRIWYFAGMNRLEWTWRGSASGIGAVLGTGYRVGAARDAAATGETRFGTGSSSGRGPVGAGSSNLCSQGVRADWGVTWLRSGVEGRLHGAERIDACADLRRMLAPGLAKRLANQTPIADSEQCNERRCQPGSPCPYSTGTKAIRILRRLLQSPDPAS